MNESMLYNALIALTTIAMAFVFFYWLWREYVIDVTRQHLFELRDQLFDMSTDGKLVRGSEAYETLRKLFNATIRFVHEFDWIHIVVFYLSARKKGAVFRNGLQVAHLVNNIEDEKVRHEVQTIMLKMHLIVSWHIFRTSLVLILLTPLVLFVGAFLSLGAKLLYRTPRKLETLINARAYSLI